MTVDKHTNFALSTVATIPSPATSGTTCSVATGTGALFPDVPFNATVWPANVVPTAANAEIVRVTGVADDDFTIVRAQEGTSARTWSVNDQIAATVTTRTLTDAEYGAHGIRNVRDPVYGAIADGVTDDTAAIQAALDAASAGETVYVPQGTYKVTARLTVDTAITIRVDGTLATTGYLYEVNPTAIFYVTADDVVIEGNGTLQGPGTFSHDEVDDTLKIPSLIRVHGADRVTIRGLRFVDGPQACVIYRDAQRIRIEDCEFVGGDTVANCVAEINYYAIHGSEGDHGRITNCRFVDDASGNTFTEGIFIYGTDYTEITRNYFRNMVDHDVYLYHAAGDTSPVNNHCVVERNVSYSTLTVTTEKVGASFKVHGEYNSISHNHIVNTSSGVVLEGGAYSQVVGNIISGFNTQGIIVSDLVATNAAGLNYITIEGNTIHGASGSATTGIYFRGDATYSTAHAVGGRIVNNTIIRCGDSGGSNPSPIELFHSNGSYFIDSFVVAGNVIVTPVSAQAVYLDRVRFSKFTGNLIKDGTRTAWKGFHFVGNSTFNELRGNTVRDDQGTPLLASGCDLSATTNTDNVVAGNTFHSLYASRSTNPWGLSATYRNTGDRNIHETTLGYPVALSTAEAVANITAASSVTISVGVPAGARLIGAQLRVESALAGGETWDVAYSGGSTTAIASAQAVAKDTKVNVLYDANAATDITSGTTNVAVTKNGGGSFTAQGTIRALVYYESLTALGNAP